VRISAKRQRSPLVLSPEQVKFGLAELEFRDQLLVFLEGALGIRQGELGALRWLECDFENMSFSVQHSYYWRRGGNLKSTKTEASAKLLPMHPSLKHSLQEWRSQSLYNKPEDFVFPSERLQGSKPLDLASVLKKKIQPAFRRIGITGVGCAGTLFGTLLEPCWRRWANISSRSATTCGTATFMSRTSTCRQHRRPNAWRRTNWSTRFCRQEFCRKQT
jgi:integrase